MIEPVQSVSLRMAMLSTAALADGAEIRRSCSPPRTSLVRPDEFKSSCVSNCTGATADAERAGFSLRER